MRIHSQASSSLFQSRLNLNRLILSTDSMDTIPNCHVLAVPYPGRGHINPMMELCKLLLSSDQSLLITFVVTEEWLGFIGSAPKPRNIGFRSIPNVIPSELVRATDFPSFLEAVHIKMGEPFERLLDGLDHPISCIIADTYLPWAVEIGNQRNIPVASFFTMSPSVFSIFCHYDVIKAHLHSTANELLESGEERLDCIPGITSIRSADLAPILLSGKLLRRALEDVSYVSKVQCLVFSCFYELDKQAIDILGAKLQLPIYSLGPTVPYMTIQESSSTKGIDQIDVDYNSWLDLQPKCSVLYISFGSFWTISGPQLDEFVMGLQSSGVRFLWVARGEATRLREKTANGEMGLVIPWCDQLRVLSHPSVGGFLTHCGWNSTMEAVFAGVPMLAFPSFWDQLPNANAIVEDWKVGIRLKIGVGQDGVIKGDEIARNVQRLMDPNGDERKELRKRVTELHETCKNALSTGGSSRDGLDAFIKNVVRVGSN